MQYRIQSIIDEVTVREAEEERTAADVSMISDNCINISQSN